MDKTRAKEKSVREYKKSNRMRPLSSEKGKTLEAYDVLRAEIGWKGMRRDEGFMFLPRCLKAKNL